MALTTRLPFRCLGGAHAHASPFHVVDPSALQPCSGEDDLFPFGNDPERSMKIGCGAWDVGQCGVFDHLIISEFSLHLFFLLSNSDHLELASQ